MLSNSGTPMTRSKTSEPRAPDRSSGEADRLVKSARCPVPREYLPLHRYLENRFADTVVLTFGQIGDLLGFALPDQARQEQWWTNVSLADAPSGHWCSWTQAGRLATPNLSARTVV